MEAALRFPFLALALSLPLPALAGTGLSAEIARDGLVASEARLAALAAPTDDQKFALAGLRFLVVIEKALQLRWNTGLMPSLSGIPFLSLPIPDNPDAPPFDAGMIADLFRTATAAMDGVRAPLALIPDGSDMSLEIDLGDLWFDINADGQRGRGEGLLDVAGPMFLGFQWLDRDPAIPAPVVVFDVADAAWLGAYSHFLAGFGDTLLAYDPTRAISEIGAARAALDALRGPPRGDLMLGSEVDWIDIAAITLRALNQTPDAPRAAAARQEFLAMVADNRIFWLRVARETDNNREWVPNDAQQSALGIEVPQGTGQVWLGVLDDAEALLQGDRLAPYLWLGDDAGVNLARMFTDPRPIDVPGWIQGIDALPYLEKGRTVSPGNWGRFQDLMAGNGLLMALLLN